MESERYRCPACGLSEGFWENVNVPGWRAVNEFLKPEGDRELDWYDAETDGDFGCSCGWEGGKDQLEIFCADDVVLEPVDPAQLRLEGVAGED